MLCLHPRPLAEGELHRADRAHRAQDWGPVCLQFHLSRARAARVTHRLRHGESESYASLTARISGKLGTVHAMPLALYLSSMAHILWLF